MWRMQDNDRVLSNPEWALFKIGLKLLWDMIEEDIREEVNNVDTGIPVFDVLTPEQKLALIANIADALRNSEIPSPIHTAANEGAIAAVFSLLKVELESELEIASLNVQCENPTELRQLLLAVGKEGELKPLPIESSTDHDEWIWLIMEFEERIFWDADFEMADDFLDLPHKKAKKMLNTFGIDADYYLSVPDDPNHEGQTAARQTLALLLDLPVPNKDGLYSALDDLYHQLTIGPCSAEEIAAWEEHPWIQVIGMSDAEFDCDYSSWLANIAKSIPAKSFQLEQTIDVEMKIPDKFNVELLGSEWVIREMDGCFWCGLLENGWTSTPDEDMPALIFSSKAEAISAFVQAKRMYEDRMVRQMQALKQLGLSSE